MTREWNFDGLVGPSHNYAGLSFGNVASQNNAGGDANPKEAALQGLEKMATVAGLGIAQGLIPPHERPHIPTLRKLGFSGSDADVLHRAAKESPQILAMCSSASAMWTANAATVTPSADAADGRLHFTPANLRSKFHRSIEPPETARLLRAIFPSTELVEIHEALPGGEQFGDEGAANHSRLCASHDASGLEVFVYGRTATRPDFAPKKFPARQSLEASQAIARLHQLPETAAIFVQQSPEVIDAGVFHNDVIATANENVLLFHERAFVDAEPLFRAARTRMGEAFLPLEVRQSDVSVEDAIGSYLFNSQLLTLRPGEMALVTPLECAERRPVAAQIQRWIDDAQTPITRWLPLDLRQSMRNGGGPACLRLRVVLSAAEAATLNPRCVFTTSLHSELSSWVQRFYRDRVSAADLADPQLLDTNRRALDELSRLLGLGAVYDFQR